MDTPLPTFRHSLAPVLRRDTWERDLLGAELARARVLAEQCRHDLEAAQAVIDSAEARMRALHRQDQTIALESRRLLHDFIGQAHIAAVARHAEWVQARTLLEQLSGQFDSKQVAVRALELHRDRQREHHDTEQTRRAQNLADALWLTRREWR
jgi:hypothetical protein